MLRDQRSLDCLSTHYIADSELRKPSVQEELKMADMENAPAVSSFGDLALVQKDGTVLQKFPLVNQRYLFSRYYLHAIIGHRYQIPRKIVECLIQFPGQLALFITGIPCPLNINS